jgi:uncharacterized membrane protein YeaQ/YmgE (transglycosylase-associated protein family)
MLSLIAGFIGSQIVDRQVQGFWARYRLCIIGALFGGFLFDSFGASGVGGLNIYSMIVAVVGSLVVLLIYNAVVGRHPDRIAAVPRRSSVDGLTSAAAVLRHMRRHRRRSS